MELVDAATFPNDKPGTSRVRQTLTQAGEKYSAVVERKAATLPRAARASNSKEYGFFNDDGRISLHSEEAFQQGLSFEARYIGSMNITAPRSKLDIVQAMRKVRLEFKNKGIKKKLVTIKVSSAGIEVTLKTGKKRNHTPLEPSPLIMHHPIHRVFYVSHDTLDFRVFSYISGEIQSKMCRCNVFKTLKKSQALEVVRTVGQAFEVCHSLEGVLSEPAAPAPATAETTAATPAPPPAPPPVATPLTHPSDSDSEPSSADAAKKPPAPVDTSSEQPSVETPPYQYTASEPAAPAAPAAESAADARKPPKSPSERTRAGAEQPRSPDGRRPRRERHSDSPAERRLLEPLTLPAITAERRHLLLEALSVPASPLGGRRANTLSPDAFSALDGRRAATLAPDAFSALDGRRAATLAPDVFSALDGRRTATLAPDVFSVLDGRRAATLSPEALSVGAESELHRLAGSSSLYHQLQLMREQLVQQQQQTAAALAQVHLVRDQLQAETAARLEAQSRTHQLLLHNRELLDHVQTLVSELQAIEDRDNVRDKMEEATSPVASSTSLSSDDVKRAPDATSQLLRDLERLTGASTLPRPIGRTASDKVAPAAARYTANRHVSK